MDDNCICIDVDEYSTIISNKVIKARKSHFCEECKEFILPGQKYERNVNKYDGKLFVNKTCLPCLRIRNDYFKCGYYFGEIWAYIHQHKCELEDDGFCMCPSKTKKIPNEY